MKRLIIFVALSGATITVFSQNHQNHWQKAPDAVRTSYQHDHPGDNASSSTWDMNNNQWHTRYQDKEHGNRNVDVYYDKDGHHLKSRTRWNRNDVPNGIKNRMRKHYHVQDYKVYQVERPEKEKVFQISWGSKNIYVDDKGHEVRY